MRNKSPFRERMRAMADRLPPPPSHPDHKLVMAAMERQSEMDVAFRLRREEFLELAPSFLLTRMQGGSGFPIANTVRHYFQEYLSRITQLGPFSFPTSFNVVESFLSFSERFFAYDLREEKEHLLRLHEYMDWYTASNFPEKPLALTDILPEGSVYAYNMVSPQEDFAIETVDSKLRILGVAMVRYGMELSGMIVAGENPPYPPDADVTGELEPQLVNRDQIPGKGDLRPDPSYSMKDRYLGELPGHTRVIMLARFDRDHSRYDVRYVNLDIGKSYLVFTDDPMVFQDETDKDRTETRAHMIEQLDRYSGLFSALASLLYLPAFFIDQATRTVETKFATALQTEAKKALVTKAIKALGPAQVPFFRTVRCLVGSSPEPMESARTVDPPDMEFQTSGYWRPLQPGEIGEAENGTPVVGKTWVERTDTWTARPLDSFVLSKTKRVIAGKDPGWIYVMRSGSHNDDIYKIGFTRRSAETRANELSSATGVPTDFEVLARWDVGDCTRVEEEIHQRLKPFRVNKRREFFRGNLQMIIGVINEVAIPPSH